MPASPASAGAGPARRSGPARRRRRRHPGGTRPFLDPAHPQRARTGPRRRHGRARAYRARPLDPRPGAGRGRPICCISCAAGADGRSCGPACASSPNCWRHSAARQTRHCCSPARTLTRPPRRSPGMTSRATTHCSAGSSTRSGPMHTSGWRIRRPCSPGSRSWTGRLPRLPRQHADDRRRQSDHALAAYKSLVRERLGRHVG